MRRTTKCVGQSEFDRVLIHALTLAELHKCIKMQAREIWCADVRVRVRDLGLGFALGLPVKEIWCADVRVKG
jgi:hypothetical protein